MNDSFQSLGFTFDCIEREKKRLMAENLKRRGLSHAQIHVLGFLDFKRDRGERCSQTDLRRECCNTRSSSVTSVLQTLERDGYITREAGDDARVKYICFTEKGLRVAHECKEFMEKLDRSFAAGFSEEEQKIFYSYLNRARDNLTQFSKTLEENDV